MILPAKNATVSGQYTAHKFKWANHWCHADPSTALFIEGPDLLLVSDLHFEKASHFSTKGQFLPPFDTSNSLKKLQGIIGRYSPRRIISLGDAFHDAFGRQRLSDENRAQLDQLMVRHDWIWVAGNHDAGELENQYTDSVLEYNEVGIRFVHEADEKNQAAFEISGHFHPCATIVQRGKHLRRRCFIFDGKRMILPAFGSLTGSLNVMHPAIQQLFDWPSAQIVILGQKSAHLLPARACKNTR